MTPEDALTTLLASIPRDYGCVDAVVKLNDGADEDHDAWNIHSCSDHDAWWNDDVEEALVAFAMCGRRHLRRKPFGTQIDFEQVKGDREMDVFVTKITPAVWVIFVANVHLLPKPEDNPVVRAVEAVLKDGAEDPK
jgi:hypothetical protein